MDTQHFQSLNDAELERVTGGATINLSGLSTPWTAVAGPLVGGILGGVGKLLNGIFGALTAGLGSLFGVS